MVRQVHYAREIGHEAPMGAYGVEQGSDSTPWLIERLEMVERGSETVSRKGRFGSPDLGFRLVCQQTKQKQTKNVVCVCGVFVDVPWPGRRQLGVEGDVHDASASPTQDRSGDWRVISEEGASLLGMHPAISQSARG